MIKELKNRKKLNEGRNHGIGFGILNKTKKGYDSITEISACKDYYNDFIFIEREDPKNFGIAHGFKWDRQEYFKDKDYMLIVLTSLDYKGSHKEYAKIDEVNSCLKNNHPIILKKIREFENKFFPKEESKSEVVEFTKVNYHTRCGESAEEGLVIKVPLYWTTYAHLTSLYMLLWRVLLNVKEEDTIVDIKPLIDNDVYLWNTVKKLFKLKKAETLHANYPYTKNKFDTYSVHDYGIQAWLNNNKNEYFQKENNKKIVC